MHKVIRLFNYIIKSRLSNKLKEMTKIFTAQHENIKIS